MGIITLGSGFSTTFFLNEAGKDVADGIIVTGDFAPVSKLAVERRLQEKIQGIHRPGTWRHLQHHLCFHLVAGRCSGEILLDRSQETGRNTAHHHLHRSASGTSSGPRFPSTRRVVSTKPLPLWPSGRMENRLRLA